MTRWELRSFVGAALFVVGCSSGSGQNQAGQEQTGTVAQAQVPGTPNAFDVSFRITSVTPGDQGNAMINVQTGPLVTHLGGVTFPPNAPPIHFFSCNSSFSQTCLTSGAEYYPEPGKLQAFTCPMKPPSSGICADWPDIFITQKTWHHETIFQPTNTNPVPLTATFMGIGDWMYNGANVDATVTLNLDPVTGAVTFDSFFPPQAIDKVENNCIVFYSSLFNPPKICFAVEVTPRVCGAPGSDITCDGIDDDCDTKVDDDPFPSGAFCGTGACAAPVMTTCAGTTTTCTPIPAPSPTDTTCDGVDDNCDGKVDEGCDTDKDGLLDVWEKAGGIDVTGDNMPDVMLAGADWQHKDLYIEMDAMKCSAGEACASGTPAAEYGVHDHMPNVALFAGVVQAFASQDIKLHIEPDESVPHVNDCCFGSTQECMALNPPLPACFNDIRSASFGTAAQRAAGPAFITAKALAYRYLLWAHHQPALLGFAGGIGSNPNLMMTAFVDLARPNGDAPYTAQVFMHELGHTLGLGHGGYEGLNFKPNYMSIMNYSYPKGVTITNTLDYSHGTLPDLLEAQGVSEPAGLQAPLGSLLPAAWSCPSALPGNARWTATPELMSVLPAGAYIDWNCNGANDSAPFVGDLNADHYCIESGKGKPLVSTVNPGDVRMGGTIIANPALDVTKRKLYSLFKCDGIAGSDMLDPVTQIVRPGTDGTLETKKCYDGALRDDQVVNKLVNSTGITSASIDLVNDEVIKDANGVIVEVRPGSDDTLQTGAGLNDVAVPYLLLPGPDKVCDSNYLSPLGVAATDKWLRSTKDNPDGEIQPGPDGFTQTQVVSGDVLIDEYIVDGPNRTCESILQGTDRVEEINGRALNSVQTAVLKDSDDWSALKLPVGTWTPSSASNAPIDPPILEIMRRGRAFNKADLTLALSASAAQTAQGAAVSFHVTLTNAGPEDAFEGVVDLRLPAGKRFASCTSTGVSCQPAGERGALDIATLAVGASVSADFVVQTSCADAGGPLTVTAQASSLSRDPNTASNTAQASTTITSGAPIFSFVPADIATTTCTGVSLAPPRAATKCGGSVVFTNNAPATFPLGRTVVTWTATSGGTSATATQVVTAMLGDSVSCCPAGSHVMLGTTNNDNLTGTAGVDCIVGLGGQDTINGSGGDDIISGGEGNDVIDGAAGNDRIYGGTGQDTLTGGVGDDALEGNDGDDILRGGTGNDVLAGGPGQDQLFGEDNDDTLRGDAGTDTLDGGNGNDYLEGNLGSDTCRGGSGTNKFVSCEIRPDAPTAGDACTNGVRDGAESAIDCGGSGCLACSSGLACTSASDCASSVCAGGLCGPTSSPLVTSLVVTSDWGAGYCMTVSATNRGSAATTGWILSIDTRQSTIYQTSKVTFSPATGVVRGIPQASEAIIAPGATNVQLSFCANRTVGNTSILPTLLSASPKY